MLKKSKKPTQYSSKRSTRRASTLGRDMSTFKRTLTAVVAAVFVGTFGSALMSSTSAATTTAKANTIYDSMCAGKVKSKKSKVKVQDSKLVEISGIAASRQRSDMYWVHNDSGNAGMVYAISSKTGKTMGSYKVSGTTSGSKADWEDIDVANGNVYIADTGTNKDPGRPVYIYKFKEPTPTSKGTVKATKITVKYSDGKTHNTEAMFVTPTGQIYLIDKSKTAATYLWKLSGDTGTVTAQKGRKIAFKSGKGYDEITGADMSKDGKYLAVRTYKNVYMYKGADGTKACKTKDAGAKKLEAIGFAANGKSLVSVSEGKNPYLFNLTVSSTKKKSKSSSGSADSKDSDSDDDDDDDDKDNKSPSPAPSPSPSPGGGSKKGDGDCTTFAYRDDQGFKCNPDTKAQDFCKNLGGHAILVNGTSPKCISKSSGCGNNQWREIFPDKRTNGECFTPDGKPGASINIPAKNAGDPGNANCDNGQTGRDASGFSCNYSEPRNRECRSIGGTHLVTLTSGDPMCVYNDNKKRCPTSNTFMDAINKGACRSAGS